MRLLGALHLFFLALACSDEECITSELLAAHEAEADEEEASLLKISLLQTGLKTPVAMAETEEKANTESVPEIPAIIQEAAEAVGIWDTLGGMVHKAEQGVEAVGNLQKEILQTVVGKVNGSLDAFDGAVDTYSSKVEAAEDQIINDANATVEEQVGKLKAKVQAVTIHARALWKSLTDEVHSLHHIVVATLDAVKQNDAAFSLNSTINGLFTDLKAASDQAILVGQDAEVLTADTASCGVMKLNATLERSQELTKSFAQKFEKTFQAIESKFHDLAKKLPKEVLGPVEKSLKKVRMRSYKTTHHLMKVQKSVQAPVIKVINALQDKCTAIGKGCGQGGLFNNIKDFFKNLFHR